MTPKKADGDESNQSKPLTTHSHSHSRADEARHDRLHYLLASRLAATSGRHAKSDGAANNGSKRQPVGMLEALFITDAAFRRRYPGFQQFADALSKARAAGTMGSAAAVEWPAAAAVAAVRRPAGGGGGSSSGGASGCSSRFGKRAVRARGRGSGSAADVGVGAVPLVSLPAASTTAAAAATAANHSALRAAVLQRLQEAQEAAAAAAAADRQSAARGRRRKAVQPDQITPGLVETSVLLALLTGASLSRSNAYRLLQQMRRDGSAVAEGAESHSVSRSLLWRLPTAAGGGAGGGGSLRFEIASAAAGAADDYVSGARTGEQIVLRRLRAAAQHAQHDHSAPQRVFTEDLLTALAAAGFDQQRGRALLRKLRRQGVIVSEQPAADSGCPRNQVVWKLPGGGEAGAGGVEGSRPRGSAEVASD